MSDNAAAAEFELPEMPSRAEIFALSAQLRRQFGDSVNPENDELMIDLGQTRQVATQLAKSLQEMANQTVPSASNALLVKAIIDAWSGIIDGLGETIETFREMDEGLTPLITDVLQTISELSGQDW